MPTALYPPLNDPPLEGDLLTPNGARGTPKRPFFSKAWQQYFARLAQAASGGIAPAGAEYVLTAPNPALPAAAVLVSTDTVTVDTATPGQVKLHARTGIAYVPLALGGEPLTFVSDGSGNPILVSYAP
jgi:hypothetical protein